jgi:predicted site-specific integrase-resolvase
MIKLSKYAKKCGISYTTAYRHFNQGFIKGKKLHTGTILVEEDEIIAKPFMEKEKRAVLYARVSSPENKKNLDTQMERLKNYASAKGYVVVTESKEIGSGLNDKRKKLENILRNNNEWDKLIIEHKDRLARFGLNYINVLLKEKNKEIEIINNTETEKEDLMQDFVSIITSFCSKLYGLRRTKRKTEKIIKECLLNKDIK